MKPSRFNRISASSLAAMAMASSAHAADGTWTQLTSGGLWSNTANWSGGTIADGSGSTANFSTLNLTADNTVKLDSDRTLTNLIFGDTTTSSAGGWILDNNGTSTNNLILAGTTPTITVNALGPGKVATITAIIEGSAGIIKEGNGTLNLGTAALGGTINTFTGGLTIKAGTVGLNFGGGSGSTGDITIGDSTGSVAATLAIMGVGGATVPTFNNAIKLGGGSGLYTISEATAGGVAFAGGVTGTGNLTLALNRTSGGSLTFQTGSVNITGTLTNGGTVTSTTSNVIISSEIGSNVMGLVQSAVNNLILTNANTAFIGDTTLTAGTLNLRNSNALQKSALNMNGGSVTFGTSTTVAITSVALGGLSGSGNINLNNTLTAPTAVNLTIGNSNASYGGNTLNPTYSGVLSNTNGAASLEKVGSNTQTLTGANTYTGGTTISAGTLQLGNGSTTGQLSTTGAIVNNGNLTINRSNAVAQGTDFSAAAITGSGSFTQAGGGTTTLNATNTYTGATLITAGTLALGASGTIDNTSEVSLGTVGTFDVSAKSGYTVGTLKGSGNVVGALTVSTTLGIGNSPGTTHFSGDLTLGAGSTYFYDLTGGVVPGAADLGDIAGNLIISSGSILDLVQLGTYTANNKFTLFAYDGTLTGTFMDASLNVLADGATFTDAGGTWMIDYNDAFVGANGGVSASNTYVTITAIPEPNAASLIGGLGVLALLRRRR